MPRQLVDIRLRRARGSLSIIEPSNVRPAMLQIARLLLAVLLLVAIHEANALPVTVSFVATDFVPDIGSTPSRVSQVSGSIVYDAASVTAPINSLTSINLSIDGHSYSIGEVGFENYTNVVYIGGLISSVRSLVPGSNDFFLSYELSPATGFSFVYSTRNSSAAVWEATRFVALSITSAATEVATVPTLSGYGVIMLALLVVVFGVWHRWRF
jgi:hypothetical protein